MKKYILIVSIILLLSVFAAFASNGDELNLTEAISNKVNDFLNVFKYDFDKLKDVPDSIVKPSSDFNEETNELVFEPFDVTEGWLYDLSDGKKVNVTLGTLVADNGDFSERYIDITGVNGNVRYLMNSYSKTENGSKTQFWSAKQQVGDSIVKDFSKEFINSVILFELDDGTKYLIGYSETGNDSFWFLEQPVTNYFINK